MNEEALTYLTLAAEARIRTLLTSSLSAQSHRTNTNHLHPPSMNLKTGKPLYSHRITSDTNSVIEALQRQNKEAEQAFRIDRMQRLAKETEVVKAKERAELAAANGDDIIEMRDNDGLSTPMKGTTGGGGGDNGGEGNNTPSGSGSGSALGSASAGPSTPVFGAVQERKGPKKTATKKAKEVSADVALKMSNMTAARSVGYNAKKYTWLNSAPHQSSPLAGKKRKVEETKVGDGKVAEEQASEGEKGKSKLKDQGESGNDKVGDDGEATGVKGESRPNKRVRSVLDLTPPSRRSVLVSRHATTGEEKRVPDDKALTIVDVLFALEKDGVGKGMETGDEILTRAWALGISSEGKR
jgi:hypothetical protein